MSNTRKFKAPFDMCGGKIPKGTIAYMAMQEVKGRFYVISANECSITLPAEIVEQWEEVFDETPKITMEDIVVGKTVLIHNNTGGEYLVIGKTPAIVIRGCEYSIFEVNSFFTIKQ